MFNILHPRSPSRDVFSWDVYTQLGSLSWRYREYTSFVDQHFSFHNQNDSFCASQYYILKDRKRHADKQISALYLNLVGELKTTNESVLKQGFVYKYPNLKSQFVDLMSKWMFDLDSFHIKEHEQRKQLRLNLQKNKVNDPKTIEILTLFYKNRVNTNELYQRLDNLIRGLVDLLYFNYLKSKRNEILEQQLQTQKQQKCLVKSYADVVTQKNTALPPSLSNVNDAAQIPNKTALYCQIMGNTVYALRILQYLLPQDFFQMHFVLPSQRKNPAEWLFLKEQDIKYSKDVECTPVWYLYDVIMNRPFIFPLVAWRLEINVRLFGSDSVFIAQSSKSASTFAVFFDQYRKLVLQHKTLFNKDLTDRIKKLNYDQRIVLSQVTSFNTCLNRFRPSYDCNVLPNNNKTDTLQIKDWWSFHDAARKVLSAQQQDSVCQVDNIPVLNQKWWETFIGYNAGTSFDIGGIGENDRFHRCSQENKSSVCDFTQEFHNQSIKHTKDHTAMIYRPEIDLKQALQKVGCFPFVKSFKGMYVKAFVCDCYKSFIEDPYELNWKIRFEKKMGSFQKKDGDITGKKQWSRAELKEFAKLAGEEISREDSEAHSADFYFGRPPCTPFIIYGTIYNYVYDDQHEQVYIQVQHVNDKNVLYHVYSFAAIYAEEAIFKGL